MAAVIYTVGLGGAGTAVLSDIMSENKVPIRSLAVDMDTKNLENISKLAGITPIAIHYESGFNWELIEKSDYY